MKHFLFGFLYFAVFSFRSFAQSDEKNTDSGFLYPIAAYDNKTMWKNWAFSACIAEIYKGNEQVDKDTRYALYAYFELGEGLDVYSQLRELLEEYLKGTPYLGHTNEGGELMLIGGNDEIKIMKCIDFYLSDELRDFVDHYVELSAHARLMSEAIRANDMAKLRGLFAGKDLTDRQFVPMTVDLLVGAIYEENFDAIRTLIELGVDPDAENRASESNLKHVLRFQQNGVRYLKAMLDGGLSPNYKLSEKNEPLLHLAVSSAPESAKEMVERNSDSKKTKDPDKKSKLEKTDFLGSVQLLVERGADINAENNDKKTALDCAVEQNKTELALYLTEKGAKFSDRTAERIYRALYRLEAGTPLFSDFIKLRDRMTAQGIDWLPPMPDPDAR